MYRVDSDGGSSERRTTAVSNRSTSIKKIKVLVVDDSAVVRKILTNTISSEPDLEVIGTAPDAFVARDKIISLKPDVLTLDIEMPGMNGLAFLKKLMRYHPMPVVIISSLGAATCATAMEALEYGALDVVAKPSGPYSVGDMRLELASKLRAAAASIVTTPTRTTTAPHPGNAGLSNYLDPRRVIAIGASTGGTNAIGEILSRMPANSPGMVIAQHIPAMFSRAFADRLNRVCALDVTEARDGDAVRPGRVLIAPGNRHMLLRESESGYYVVVKDGPQVCYQRPSVDVLFTSVAETAGSLAVGVLLTGMGADGAMGLLAMKAAGANTIAQDEASCTVYGMPREALVKGAVEGLTPLSEIPLTIRRACGHATKDATNSGNQGIAKFADIGK